MDPEKTTFLSLRRIPRRLTAKEVGWFLGFEPHEVPMIGAAGLLKPLGNPKKSGRKYYLTALCETLGQNEKWMARASNAVIAFWQKKDAGRKSARKNGNGKAAVLESEFQQRR